MPLLIRPVLRGDRYEWLQMRDQLWPGAFADHDVETQAYFAEPKPGCVTFIALSSERAVGFLELEQRSYAPGCSSSPVPFIEGWYVAPGARRQGVGRALVAAAEEWARAAGHRELGSDVELENTGSIAAHAALGYAEVERVVCFRKSLV
jgi:aminoglycoside 6'-N-acetyltransferase I